MLKESGQFLIFEATQNQSKVICMRLSRDFWVSFLITESLFCTGVHSLPPFLSIVGLNTFDNADLAVFLNNKIVDFISSLLCEASVSPWASFMVIMKCWVQTSFSMFVAKLSVNLSDH